MALGSYKEQTAVQDAETIRIGSVKLEIGPYGGGYSNVGALRGATFKEGWTDVLVKSDNAGILDEGITDHVVEINGEWFEINVANLGIAFDGIGTDDTVAAAPVSITDEAILLNDYDLTEFLHKNGDGSEVDSIVVADAATPTITYIRDCDYVVVTKADGHMAIARAYATVIESASVLITVATPGKTYTLSAGAWDVQPAVGDHIIVAGCGEAGNNGVKTVTAVTSTVITVDEACTAEAEGASITITRGGIADAATVYADYDYTPLTSRTYTSGGKTSKSALMIRLTNYDIDDKEWVMLVHKAKIGDGLNLVFPADDDRNPMPCPVKFIGRLDTARASGDQLFGITDSQDTT
jgi:hypothetical protein